MRGLLKCLSVFLVMAAAYACVPLEERVFDGEVVLAFSLDTVYYDTVFTEQKTVTKRLYVYNKNSKSVVLNKVYVKGGEDSPFKIKVNGLRSNSVTDVKIMGGDSLLILLEGFPEARHLDSPDLIEDYVVFEPNKGNPQEIVVRAWGQDAEFVSGELTNCNAVWNNKKPFVALKSVIVPEGCTLTVNEGVQVHFAPGAFLIVQGKLRVEASPDSAAVFQGLRLDADYAGVTGQWGGVLFAVGSKDNHLKSTAVINSFYGIYIGTPDDDQIPDLVLESSYILNTASNALDCASSDVVVRNSLIAKSVGHSMLVQGGGNYVLENNTMVNSKAYFFRDDDLPVVAFLNYLQNNGQLVVDDLNLEMTNNVIWGDLEDEMVFAIDERGELNISAQTNLLKTALYAEAFEGVGENILNQDPLFKDIRSGNFFPDTLSPLIGAATPLPSIPLDIEGNERGGNPDIGAYQRQE